MFLGSYRFVIAVSALAMASAAPAITYMAFLDGPSEAPPNASPGTGFAIVDLNIGAMSRFIDMNFSGLIGNTTAAHIHAATANPGSGTAGVATQTPTFTGFPLGVTSGSYTNTFDMSLSSSWNASYITANGGTTASAWSAFTTAVAQGRAYFNVHTNQFPGGEIRGFLAPVPEPGTLAALGLGAAALLRRRKR